MGLYLGTVFERNPHNQKGNRENESIMLLNDALLAHNGGSWHNPPNELNWTDEHRKERDRLIKDFESAPAAIWGFKDPRVLLTISFWLEALPYARLAGTFRHPMLVARSLARRNQLSLHEGLALWYSYNVRLLDLFNRYRFPLISFDVSPGFYRSSIKVVAHHLGLDTLADGGPSEAFFDDTLRHEMASESVELPKSIEHIYRQLQAGSNMTSAPEA